MDHNHEFECDYCGMTVHEDVMEKAKRYDSLMAANSEIVQTNITMSQLQEKLRKFEVMQYTPNEMEIRLNTLTKLKYDLEQFDIISIIVSNNEIDDYSVDEIATEKNWKLELEKMIKSD